jgi:transposase InsO family protein
MTERNTLVDASTHMEFIFHFTPLELAKGFHQLYNVPTATLQQKFNIFWASARTVVLQCPQFVHFHHPPHVGINPLGLIPLKIRQMDVTRVPAFGNFKYVHVSIDTCSGIMYASPMSGEKTCNVISHCLDAWAAWGKPANLKTDNGPAYTSTSFQVFCETMEVSHTTALPYNPQGQDIVERAHSTLKELLQKQKEGIAYGRAPKEQLSLALFTLIFLIFFFFPNSFFSIFY